MRDDNDLFGLPTNHLYTKYNTIHRPNDGKERKPILNSIVWWTVFNLLNFCRYNLRKAIARLVTIPYLTWYEVWKFFNLNQSTTDLHPIKEQKIEETVIHCWWKNLLTVLWIYGNMASNERKRRRNLWSRSLLSFHLNM